MPVAGAQDADPWSQTVGITPIGQRTGEYCARDSLFNPALLYTSPLGPEMHQDSLTGYDGLANGYVLTFTNGLTVYLTGDTGVTAEMMIVQGLYHPNLAVANVDGMNNMGPEEARSPTRARRSSSRCCPMSSHTCY